jgi:flavin prenyltransferase
MKQRDTTPNLGEIRLAIGVTGASGQGYADALLRAALQLNIRVYLVFTETARKVVQTEVSKSLLAAAAHSKLLRGLQNDESVSKVAELHSISKIQLENLKIFDNQDFYSPIASGSVGATHMAIVPCSMGTMGRIAGGMSTCLVERCADVMLKERRPLCLVPRETPLSQIHLKNMLALADCGASILPAMPGFYFQPKSIEELFHFISERILESLKIDSPKSVRWNDRML